MKRGDSERPGDAFDVGDVERRVDDVTARLIRSLEEGTLEALDHHDHVRVAWGYLHRMSLAETLVALPEVLRAYAAGKGLPDAYHETITFAFVCLIHERVVRHPGSSWRRFAEANPDLFERDLLGRYYPGGRLESDEARRVFLLPRPRNVMKENP